MIFCQSLQTLNKTFLTVNFGLATRSDSPKTGPPERGVPLASKILRRI